MVQTRRLASSRQRCSSRSRRTLNLCTIPSSKFTSGAVEVWRPRQINLEVPFLFPQGFPTLRNTLDRPLYLSRRWSSSFDPSGSPNPEKIWLSRSSFVPSPLQYSPLVLSRSGDLDRSWTGVCCYDQPRSPLWGRRPDLATPCPGRETWTIG